jgi:formylglycine-generating enzyme required for sulfatase activity
MKPDDAPIRRYELGERLGKGGMAEVYRAHDHVLGRAVALKLVEHGDPLSTHRFLREARAQAKVEHPNICRIYEVGELDGRPFIAMQLIEGRTLAAATADMSLEQQVDVMRKVALAVHAAHEAGLVHRDLKPSNILVESDGSGAWHPYVMDFGIARERDGGDLTLTGQVLGTPWYMAPEQALGHRTKVDRRTDVYALGATLYEVLSRTPPFQGNSVAEVLKAVVERDPVPIRQRNPRVPLDLDTVVTTCLQKEMGRRYASAQALADDLARYLDGKPLHAQRLGPARKAFALARRQKAITGAVAGALMVTLGVAVVPRVAAQRERERLIAARELEGRRALAEGNGLSLREEGLRNEAFRRFDAHQAPAGEEAWAQARRAGADAEHAFVTASRTLEAALTLDPERRSARAALADTLLAWALWSEQHERSDRDLVERLAIYDDDGSRRARFAEPSHLRVVTEPAGARVSLSEYVADGRGKRREAPRGELGLTPLADVTLAPGSYVFSLQLPGRRPVRCPVRVTRGHDASVELELPTSDLPDGFVFVPGGRFLTGNADEAIREWFGNPPLHEARTAPFLIARTEVTVAEWLTFLEALPAPERERRTPKVATSGGTVAAERLGPRRWRYRLAPDRDHAYTAGPGELLIYPRRTAHARQDWTRFPVTGVSPDDATAYAAWLNDSGRVPGARLCTDAEWEHAARGADDREYPAGDRLDRNDANFDETYDRLDWGPDEVGMHPESVSPFGVEDMAGNAAEWVRLDAARFAERSGSFNLEVIVSDLTNQTELPRDARDASFGVRLCVTFPPVAGARGRP